MARPLRLMLVQTQAENAGAQEISRLLAQGFEARGHAVTQLFFFRRTASFDGAANALFCSASRPGTPLAFLAFLWRLFRILRRERPDVVLTFQHYGNLIGGPMARLAGVRRVVGNQVSAQATMSAPVRFLDRLLCRLGIFSVVTVNSDDTEAEYGRDPALRRRLVRIDHGFEDKSCGMPKPAARAGLGLPQAAVLLGCVARLHPLKQLDALIRILPRRAQWHAAFAGQGADEARLRALATSLGVADRVHFLGELPPERIGVFLAALDVFVFPSLAETFGLAAVEAAQAGVPVVANRLPVLEEVLAVDHQPCALFADAANPEELGQAVARVLDDGALAATLTARGRRLGSRYSLGAMVDKYLAIVEGRPA